MTKSPSDSAPTGSQHSAEAESRNHAYRSAVIPWYVHLIWISFWIGAVNYIWFYLIPMMKVEVFNPP